MSLGIKGRLSKLMAMVGCSAFLVACEAVPTEEDEVMKGLAGKVSVGIRPVESELQAAQPMEVLFYLNNGTDAPIELLPWGTPLEQMMTADRFSVTLQGTEILYGGPVVKRPAPGPDDYTTLAPGEKRETVVTLSDGYDVTAAGEYEISLRKFDFQGAEGDFISPVIVDSAVVITRL